MKVNPAKVLPSVCGCLPDFKAQGTGHRARGWRELVTEGLRDGETERQGDKVTR